MYDSQFVATPFIVLPVFVSYSTNTAVMLIAVGCSCRKTDKQNNGSCDVIELSKFPTPKLFFCYFFSNVPVNIEENVPVILKGWLPKFGMYHKFADLFLMAGKHLLQENH